MDENRSGRAAGLFLAILGVSAAVGLAVFWMGSQRPDGRAADEVAEPAPVAKSEAPEPAKVAKAAPKRKTKITWEGGGTADNTPSNVRVYAGPPRPYYTGGAVNQPKPARFVQFKTTREQLPNGKTRITLYRSGS
jgi:hypothetical protein